MYLQIYQLFIDTVYGGLTLTPDMTLTATIISTTACVFCFALPFIVVWRFIRAVC